MKKIKNNQLGFGAVESILIFIIIALVAGTGWYVWKQNKSSNNSGESASSTPATTEPTTTTSEKADPYEGWKTSTLKYEKISFKYPSNWTLADKSEAYPKSAKGCTYPGHDLVTLTSPNQSTFNFNEGQACFGYIGDTNYGSVPVKSLGQDMFIGFLGYADTYISKDKPDAACLIATSDGAGRYDLKSKNIFFNDEESKPTSNMFCYSPKGTPNSAGEIKSSPDFATAKLIFESLSY